MPVVPVSSASASVTGSVGSRAASSVPGAWLPRNPLPHMGRCVDGMATLLDAQACWLAGLLYITEVTIC